MTIFFAAIGTASDVVTGDYCDLTVTEAIVCGYHLNEDGTESEDYGFGGNTILDTVDLPVRTDEDDKLGLIEKAAEEILWANGWRVVGGWDSADNAAYAQVERA